MLEERGGSLEELRELKKKYEMLYEEVSQDRKKLYINNGRAIIVFNKIEDRVKIYK